MEQPRRCMFTTRSLILLMLPIMGDTLLSQLVGMVDGIMVSSVGELAMSSVSLVTNFSAVIMNLLIALASGGSIVTSQLIGAEKHKDAQRSAGQVITMSVLFSIGIGFLCLCFCFNCCFFLLGLSGGSTAAADKGCGYCQCCGRQNTKTSFTHKVLLIFFLL